MELAVWHYFNVCGADCPHRQVSVGVETDSALLLSDLSDAQIQEEATVDEKGMSMIQDSIVLMKSG